MSGAISRVLYWVIIYLGLPLPAGSSNLPGSTTGRRIASCLVLLRMGFTFALAVTVEAVSSYLTISPLPAEAGGIISVALSWESPPPDVIRHPALRSPDFPRGNPRDHLHRSMKSTLTSLISPKVFLRR